MQRFIYDRSATNIRDWSLAYSFTCLCVFMTLCPHSPCIYVSISPFHLVSLQMSLSNYVLCLLLEVLPRTKLLVRLMVVLLDGCLVGRSFGLSVIIDGKLQFHCSYLSQKSKRPTEADIDAGYHRRCGGPIERQTYILTERVLTEKNKTTQICRVSDRSDIDRIRIQLLSTNRDRDPDPCLFLDQIRIQGKIQILD